MPDQWSRHVCLVWQSLRAEGSILLELEFLSLSLLGHFFIWSLFSLTFKEFSYLLHKVFKIQRKYIWKHIVIWNMTYKWKVLLTSRVEERTKSVVFDLLRATRECQSGTRGRKVCSENIKISLEQKVHIRDWRRKDSSLSIWKHTAERTWDT